MLYLILMAIKKTHPILVFKPQSFSAKGLVMTKSTVAFFKNIFPISIALVFCVAVSGCQKEEGTMENAGKKIDQGLEKTAKVMKQAGEKIGEGAEAVKDAGVTVGEKAEDGWEATKEKSAEGLAAAKDAGVAMGEKAEDGWEAAKEKSAEGVEATKDALGMPVQKTGEQTQK